MKFDEEKLSKPIPPSSKILEESVGIPIATSTLLLAGLIGLVIMICTCQN